MREMDSFEYVSFYVPLKEDRILNGESSERKSFETTNEADL